MSLTEPITAAALEASPAPDGEASLLSEHSADIARFHAAVAQNRRLLGDRPGTGTGTAGRGRRFEMLWGWIKLPSLSYFLAISYYEMPYLGWDEDAQLPAISV